uniref:Uncharacterized protein n=1 Tax=Zea mays TaxID=4577 RepID=C4J117_MAIZE|nr:unknown [Zea mays]
MPDHFQTISSLSSPSCLLAVADAACAVMEREREHLLLWHAPYSLLSSPMVSRALTGHCVVPCVPPATPVARGASHVPCTMLSRPCDDVIQRQRRE